VNNKLTWILLLSFVLALGSANVRAQHSSLSLLPSSERIGQDSVLMVVVHLAAAERLHAYSVDILYDTTVVHYQSLQRLPFFSGSTFFASNIDSANGKIVIDEAILGAWSQNGTAGVALLRFTASKPGTAAFKITSSALRDSINRPIPVDNQGTTVTVVGREGE
jgi:hypothetical protein